MSYLIDDSFIATIRRIIKKVDGIRGRGVKNTPDAIFIGDDGAPTPRQFAQDDFGKIFSAKISAVPTAINGAIRFTYKIEIGHRDMSTSAATGGAWVTDNNNGGAGFTAYSEAEDMNIFTSGTGTIGTGNTTVMQSDGTIGTGSCKLIPLPNGGYVSVKLRGFDPAASKVYFTIIAGMNSAE